MIAATNPFLGLSTPITPMGVIHHGKCPMVRIETATGRIIEVPASLPPESLVQICDGSSWLVGQFPDRIVRRGIGRMPKDWGFCAFRAARALIDACMHAEQVRQQRRKGASA